MGTGSLECFREDPLYGVRPEDVHKPGLGLGGMSWVDLLIIASVLVILATTLLSYFFKG
jgi:hypothetical protein